MIEAGQSFDAALEEVRRTTVFTTHTPVRGRARRVPVQPRRDASGGLLGHARRVPRPIPAARRVRQRQRTAVQHDGARAAHGERRQRGQPAARRGHARDVGPDLAGRAGGPAAGPRDHQRHPHADVALERAGAAVRRLPARRTGATATTIRRCGRASSTSPTRRCGRRVGALREYLFAFIRERARERWRDEQVSAARVVAAGTLLDPNALTIGFARRFTGYKRAELIFHDPERLQAHPERGAPSGADRLRGQGASGRRDRQAPPPAGLPPRDRSRVRRARSPSSTTTTCTSRTSSSRAATSG